MDGTVDIFYPAAGRVVSMHWVEPGTANSEDSIHWYTLPSRRTKFKDFGADEFLRCTRMNATRSNICEAQIVNVRRRSSIETVLVQSPCLCQNDRHAKLV